MDLPTCGLSTYPAMSCLAWPVDRLLASRRCVHDFDRQWIRVQLRGRRQRQLWSMYGWCCGLAISLRWTRKHNKVPDARAIHQSKSINGVLLFLSFPFLPLHGFVYFPAGDFRTLSLASSRRAMCFLSCVLAICLCSLFSLLDGRGCAVILFSGSIPFCVCVCYITSPLFHIRSVCASH